MKAFGAQVVAGATPGKGGQVVEGVPVFDSVEEAVRKTGANASCIFVPAPFAKDALLEAVDAGIPLAVIVTEHIPFHDMLVMYHYGRSKGAADHRAELPGDRCPWQVQGRDHPERRLPPGPRRRRQPERHADLRDRQRDQGARARPVDLPRPRAETRSSGHRSSTPCRSSRRTRRPTSSSWSGRSAGPPRRMPPSTSGTTSRSRSSPTSRAAPPRPGSGWVTPARSSPGGRGRPRASSPRSQSVGAHVAKFPYEIPALVEQYLPKASGR